MSVVKKALISRSIVIAITIEEPPPAARAANFSALHHGIRRDPVIVCTD
jgi:hypothetical protein